MKNTERLFSLDALRGLDMLLLTVVGPLIAAANTSWKCFPKGMMSQFAHNWSGFTLWDIIMPLFIFLCGAAIPFALDKRLQAGPKVFWRHVLARVAMLWIWGGLVQGDWHQFDALRFSPFSNTLQSIAIGYLVVAAVMTLRSRRLMVIVPVVLTAGYTALLAVSGYEQHGNIAFLVDQAIFKAVLPAESSRICDPSFYTWFLTSMMFASMTFAGYHATRILQRPISSWRKAGWLSAYGVGLLAVGLVSENRIPCIKPIYTLSFTAQAMGWCVLALAGLYVVTDIWQLRKGWAPVLLFGQCALTAYIAATFFRPVLTSAAHLFGDGIISHLPASSEAFVIRALITVELVFVMLVWRKLRQGSRA